MLGLLLVQQNSAVAPALVPLGLAAEKPGSALLRGVGLDPLLWTLQLRWLSLVWWIGKRRQPLALLLGDLLC